MNLGEIFRSNVITVDPDDTMIDAMRLMQQHGVGAVVAVREGQVVGMLTDRDVALAVVLGTATPDSAVSETMTRNVATIWEDQGIFDATQAMQGRHVRRLPIVSRQNELIGMVAFDDIVALLAKEFHNISEAISPALADKAY
ncbi:MAG TPA: CBS domain-containing protein [Pirellulales bacterium]|jgi:CBS domain-containing protein|nr:CBS domain-containing protein [Pirellulales bacterium]